MSGEDRAPFGASEMLAEFVRVPGLFRWRELWPVITVPDAIYRIEQAGCAEDGTTLFAVYRRDPIT